jgi:hypothetical protein
MGTHGRGARAGASGSPVSRRALLGAGAGVLGAGLLGAGALDAAAGGARGKTAVAVLAASSTSDDDDVQWNNTALQAVRDLNPGPTIAARALAIMHTAMYDAWAAFDPVAVPTRPNGIPRHRGPNQGLGSKNQSISFAAYRALLDLFPGDTAVFQAQMKSLGYDATDTSADTSSPSGVGNVAAQAVLSYRHGDGSNQLNGYADTTGYQPVNTPDQIIDPLHWQPLRVNGKVQKYLTPHWGTVTPFAPAPSSAPSARS